MPYCLNLPIDLASHKFGKDNAWVVVGLPDNEAQWDKSLSERAGIGTQGPWSKFRQIVTFVEGTFAPDHPLHNARRIRPELSASGDVVVRGDLFPCYDLRRRQLINLQALGLHVVLGATCENFIEAADAAFSCGGLLSVITHFDEHRGFEFNDAFLAVEDIPKHRPPSGRGLLDGVACCSGRILRQIKANLSPAVWANAPTRKISAAAWLLHRVEFYTSIIQQPKTFLSHMRTADQALRAHGLLPDSTAEAWGFDTTEKGPST